MKTEILKFEPVSVYYIKAASFPEGVLAAHQQLHGLVNYSEKRMYFGISAPNEKGVIAYRAAATELEAGELSRHGLECFLIPGGSYTCITLKDFRKDIGEITRAFSQLLTNPSIDPNGFCLEWYINKNDVRCMVRLIP